MSNAKAANVQSIKMEKLPGESGDKATARCSAAPEVRRVSLCCKLGPG